MSEKVLENRLRRVAARRGLRLEKSRRRDTRATDYGRYCLMAPAVPPQDYADQILVMGDLATIEKFLGLPEIDQVAKLVE